MTSSHAPQILFEDTHLIVLSKPAGLLSQGDKSGEENLVDWLRRYLGRNYVGLIHRLDRNTSGIMVVAKRSKAAERLTKALQQGDFIRTYQAWLVGILKKEETWNHWLLKDAQKNQMRVCTSKAKGAKEASLSVKPIKKGMWKKQAVTLVRIKLETGRSHQIRIQAAEKNLPILGDFKYGAYSNAVWNRDFGRPALHSDQVSFPHPMSKETMKFCSPLPPEMKNLHL